MDELARLDVQGRGPRIDYSIAAAAQWIIHSGRSLFRSQGEERGYANERATMGGPLWQGRSGLSLARWQFWQQRFIGISRMLNGNVKRIAIEAEQKMAAIEQEQHPLLS